MLGYLRNFGRLTEYKRLVLRRFVKYVVILLCFLLVTCPIIFESYRMARERTIRQTTTQMKSALSTLSQTLEKGTEIRDALRTEEEFMSLLLLDGAPTSPYYPYINSLQNKLSAWCFHTDYIVDIYITFRDNPLWIGSRVNSSDDASFYGSYFYYEGMDFAQWRACMYDERYINKFLPQNKTYYQYVQPNLRDTLTFFVNASPYPSMDTSCVIGYVFDTQEITEDFLSSELGDSALLYVQQKDGTVLWQYGCEGIQITPDLAAQKTISVNGKSYTLLQTEDSLTGLRAVVGVPNELFNKQIASLLAIILFYFCVGLTITIVLSVGFTLREANENVRHQQQVQRLNRAIQISTLENLFMAGVHTEKDEKQALENSQCSFDRFCVVRILLPPSDTQSLFSVEDELHRVLQYSHLCFSIKRDELNAIIFLENEPEVTEQNIARLLQPIIDQVPADYLLRIGISQIAGGVRKVRAAYLQASRAVSLGETDSSNIQIYEQLGHNQVKKIFDPTILLKLSEIIRTGDQETAQQLFDKIFSFVQQAKPDEQDAVQLYFCIRQILTNEHADLYMDGKETGAQPLALPVYSPRESMQDRLQDLKQATLGLCEEVNRRKKSNNLVLKEKILTYLQQNYSNSNLNASVVAQALSVSEKYVFSFIKANTGKTLGKYIEDLRLEKSEELLRTTALTNRRIAEEVGFGSENTFYRIFAKKHGLTPTKWRENNR